jgi:hypothetical protein
MGLSAAAVSDTAFIETHDPNNVFSALWHQPLRRSTSESGRLCRGDRA